MSEQRTGRACFVLTFLVGVCTFSAAQQPSKIVVSPARCTHLSAAQEQWLPSEWKPFLEYTRSCPIRNAKHITVVLLVSPRADLYYKAQPGQTVTQIELPHAALFSPSGESLGSLPYAFPNDPPAALRVTFTRWEHDFPQRIELFLTDPRASGNRSLPPYVWNQSEKKYLPREEKRHG